MCNFSIPFSSDAESLIRRAKTEIEKSGGTFQGHSADGNFTAKTPIGSIAGSYQIEGQTILMAISKKPFLLSCKRIEKELSGMLK